VYTRENDATRLERSHGSDLDPTVLARMLSKLSIDLSSNDVVNPPARCTPLCLDQVMRSLLLKVLPTLDDIDIIVRQMGDQSRGVHIPETGVAGSWRSADITLGPSKGKEKATPSRSTSKARSWSTPSDTEMSPEDTVPRVRRMRLVHSDGSSVDELPLLG
jgi:hypothetical protein